MQNPGQQWKKDPCAPGQPTLSQAPFNIASLPFTSCDLWQITCLSVLHFPPLEEIGDNYTCSVYLNRVPNASERIQIRGDEPLSATKTVAIKVESNKL